MTDITMAIWVDGKHIGSAFGKTVEEAFNNFEGYLIQYHGLRLRKVKGD